MDYLDILEAEAIYILREVAAQFKKPVLLFSGGKDSTLLIHLSIKAFYPDEPPFPVMHIDTGHNFEETLQFRDELVNKYGLKLIVCKVEDTIRKRGLEEPKGKFPSRNILQSQTLLDAINEFEFDACIGGGRRDEEKARAKERIFSVRNAAGGWQPYDQRPELWDLYNGNIHEGQNVRVFPISNWSELDVWNYIRREKIELPSLYFAHPRQCVQYNNRLIAVSDYMIHEPTDVIVNTNVRYRTIGDMTCTAAIASEAADINSVISEIENSPISERGETRMDDSISDAGMEDRKLNGYF
ncbi:MAG TPA: sulfate adenylyltransferase subunit CysD [Flavipsychrobacter sp.]|nr:sulfate adenylyltransferase subunit CysD [Flavipsychrobacter sp.]